MLVLGLMGVVHAPVYLILLRLVQGALCGSVSAAQTLVATHTPEEHSGFALGSLNSAVFSGALTGAFIGGFAAEYFGYRTAFLISGFLMLIPFLLVLFGVHEYFVPLLHSHRGFFSSITPKKRHLALALPLLFLMGTVMFARQFDSSFIPLFVQDINGGIDGGAAGVLRDCGSAFRFSSGISGGPASSGRDRDLFRIDYSGIHVQPDFCAQYVFPVQRPLCDDLCQQRA